MFPKTEAHAVQLKNAAGDIVKAGKEGHEKREDILNRANNYHAIMSAELKKKNRWFLRFKLYLTCLHCLVSNLK